MKYKQKKNLVYLRFPVTDASNLSRRMDSKSFDKLSKRIKFLSALKFCILCIPYSWRWPHQRCSNRNGEHNF